MVAALARLPAAEPVPHNQDRLPGPPLLPAEALRHFKVPPGFSVELVAAEPDLVNPVAMTFDERGRIWVTESLEYPRQSAGPGRDRVKVLEDTDGDGKVDKVTLFAEGLNIPSGIAVGHGGVWVANSPDLLFYKIGPDGRAAGKPEVVATGFGRLDTHELPNSLSWGPDGWLYGLNGVFNTSSVRSNNGKQYVFTCALFRVHPKTREFQLFCEGTSNPWGLAFDGEGSAFVSACVIDHLWHLTETGYYQRQAGAYPPFTWVLGSVVRHHHQKAAYCGLCYFDSEAYPPEYRGKLYMGNIHGNCVNSDELTRDGSTYLARPRPDLLSTDDAWFMPVSQKVGPDGCLYVLDWYDRYHCYQDAQRDSPGLDRLRGRLYRVRYKDAPRAPQFDLARESDQELIERLGSPNVYFRDTAQRLLYERDTLALRDRLRTLVFDDAVPRRARMHALWALVSTGRLEPDFHRRLLAHADAGVRAWGVRAAGNFGKVDPSIRTRVAELARDDSADVRLQVAVAARKVDGLDPVGVLLDVLASSEEDQLIPAIVWQNLHPLLEGRAEAFLRQLAQGPRARRAAVVTGLLPRVIDRTLADDTADPAALARVFGLLTAPDRSYVQAARKFLEALTARVEGGEVRGDRLRALSDQFGPVLRPLVDAGTGHPLHFNAAVLALVLKDRSAGDAVRAAFLSARHPDALRVRAFEALVAVRDEAALEAARTVLGDGKGQSEALRGRVLDALGKLDDPRVAGAVLEAYGRLEADLQPRAIEVLTQRPGWGKELMKAVARKQVSGRAINVNEARRMLAARDPELAGLVKTYWGTLRRDRNPQREQVVTRMRDFLRRTPGDPRAGAVVFKSLCAQCHKIHGEGQDVGPDITGSGRASFDQLLTSVFDPSLVIGAAYQATTVVTKGGRSLTGLVVEDGPRRVVLKVQGGQQEAVPREDVEEMSVSPVSLMPEGIENQLKAQELADLFAFLCLDRPPGDPAARKIPGAP
jgi:putative heme-binding domain-containing protein